jgi:hypothetical protein
MANMEKPGSMRLVDGITRARQSMQAQSALEADAVTYYPSIFCQLSLPTAAQKGSQYQRINRASGWAMNIFTDERVGIPYGPFARAILAFIAQQVTLRKHAGVEDPRVIELGDGVSDFLEQLTGTQNATGGVKGNLTLLRRQLRSVSQSLIQFSRVDPVSNEAIRTVNYQFMREATHVARPHLWQPGVNKTGKIIITIGEDFYYDLVEHAAPFDSRVLKALWPSCLRLDIATWLAYRGNQGCLLQKAIGYTQPGGYMEMSWAALQDQFGVGYESKGSERVFRKRFKEAFEIVRQVYDPSDPDCIKLDQVGDRLRINIKRPMMPCTFTSEQLNRMVMLRSERSVKKTRRALPKPAAEQDYELFG